MSTVYMVYTYVCVCVCGGGGGVGGCEVLIHTNVNVIGKSEHWNKSNKLDYWLSYWLITDLLFTRVNNMFSFSRNCFIKTNGKLEVICHADKLRWYASTEWIENLSTFPTSDSKLKTTLSIAHSLSYNILNLGTKWSHNNRDTAQRSLPCRFMFVKKSDLP